MNREYIVAQWSRAIKSLRDAEITISHSPDTAANRAYYSAFYAVSALFASEDMYFKKHTNLRGAVHKELIHTGRWPLELGADYDKLMEMRETADYGAMKHVPKEAAEESITRAGRILEAVHKMNPSLFPLQPELDVN